MSELSTETIDGELASRTKEVAAMSATLVELDEPSRAGARAPLSADGPDRAALGRHREGTRRAVGGPGPDDVDPGLRARGAGAPIQGLRRRPRRIDETAVRAPAGGVAAADPVVPAHDHAVPPKSVESIGLADIADRMRAEYPAVAEFFDSVDRVNSLIAEGLGPTRKRLDAAGAADPKEMADLLAVSATDPLSLTTAGRRPAHPCHRVRCRTPIG